MLNKMKDLMEVYLSIERDALYYDDPSICEHVVDASDALQALINVLNKQALEYRRKLDNEYFITCVENKLLGYSK